MVNENIELKDGAFIRGVYPGGFVLATIDDIGHLGVWTVTNRRLHFKFKSAISRETSIYFEDIYKLSWGGRHTVYNIHIDKDSKSAQINNAPKVYVAPKDIKEFKALITESIGEEKVVPISHEIMFTLSLMSLFFLPILIMAVYFKFFG